MKIPRTVKIGAARYAVKMEVEAFASIDAPNGMKENVGEHVPSLRILRVSDRSHGKKIPEESVTDTILHEILHAVSRVYGIGLDENQVAGLTGGLMQVIRDNKLDFR
uniref:Peptidase n=1 Tax=viral metagenome TaxID=1070528 RepID=A0A6M3J4C3_9ZZZZ